VSYGVFTRSSKRPANVIVQKTPHYQPTDGRPETDKERNIADFLKARTERRNWTELNWHGLIVDELTDEQVVRHYSIRWLRSPTRQPMTSGLALLAHWSVRQKLYRVNSVQLRRFVHALTASNTQTTINWKDSPEVVSMTTETKTQTFIAIPRTVRSGSHIFPFQLTSPRAETVEL